MEEVRTMKVNTYTRGSDDTDCGIESLGPFFFFFFVCYSRLRALMRGHIDMEQQHVKLAIGCPASALTQQIDIHMSRRLQWQCQVCQK